MKLFIPQRVIFDENSLNYEIGKKVFEYFTNTGVEVIHANNKNIARIIPGKTPIEKYVNSKRTILITTEKNKKLDICRPSADYQFALVKNCPGNCEYCYLQTTQGTKPYIKIFVNLEDIFETIKEHIKKDEGKVTTFEVASLGDPLALEHITGSLAKTIEFFSGLKNAKLRVVTKYCNVEPLLNLEHNNNTQFRVSINSPYVINNFEHNTASLKERIDAITKLTNAGYPIGFIVAPIMIYENWQKDYENLFIELKEGLGPINSNKELTFELIQHRFTSVAKNLIMERFPNTKLDMVEENRDLKWGRFGRYKYVYHKEQAEEIKKYFYGIVESKFPNAEIKYFT